VVMTAYGWGAEHFCVSVLFGFEAAAVFFHIFSANISTECGNWGIMDGLLHG